jgi:hypothetical protein
MRQMRASRQARTTHPRSITMAADLASLLRLRVGSRLIRGRSRPEAPRGVVRLLGAVRTG